MQGRSKGVKRLKSPKLPRGHKVPKRSRARVTSASKPSEIVVVSAAQYKRLTGPDKPSEVPSALRELVLQSRSSTAVR